MTTRTIEIDGMKGERCVQQVDQALAGVNGVEVKSVAVGSAVLECRDEAACSAACGAIAGAGYKARESNKSESGPRASGPNEKGPPGRPIEKNPQHQGAAVGSTQAKSAGGAEMTQPHAGSSRSGSSGSPTSSGAGSPCNQKSPASPTTSSNPGSRNSEEAEPRTKERQGTQHSERSGETKRS